MPMLIEDEFDRNYKTLNDLWKGIHEAQGPDSIASSGSKKPKGNESGRGKK